MRERERESEWESRQERKIVVERIQERTIAREMD